MIEVLLCIAILVLGWHVFAPSMPTKPVGEHEHAFGRWYVTSWEDSRQARNCNVCNLVQSDRIRNITDVDKNP